MLSEVRRGTCRDEDAWCRAANGELFYSHAFLIAPCSLYNSSCHSFECERVSSESVILWCEGVVVEDYSTQELNLASGT
jgi:hypothetical protein